MKSISNLIGALLLLVSLGFGQDDLIAHFAFSGDATDQSPSGNTAVINGAEFSSDRFGEIDQAIGFDGASDFVQISSTPQYFGSDTISTNIWYAPGTELPFAASRLFNKDNQNAGDSNRSYYLRVDGLGDNQYTFVWNVYNTALTTTALFYTATIQPGDWCMLTGLYDGDVQKLFFNDSLVGEMAVSLPRQPGNAPIYLGRSNYDITWLNGSLDDFRIYNRMLSDSEISELYHATSDEHYVPHSHLEDNFSSYDTLKWTQYDNGSNNVNIDQGIAGEVYIDGARNWEPACRITHEMHTEDDNFLAQFDLKWTEGNSGAFQVGWSPTNEFCYIQSHADYSTLVAWDDYVGFSFSSGTAYLRGMSGGEETQGSGLIDYDMLQNEWYTIRFIREGDILSGQIWTQGANTLLSELELSLETIENYEYFHISTWDNMMNSEHSYFAVDNLVLDVWNNPGTSDTLFYEGFDSDLSQWNIWHSSTPYNIEIVEHDGNPAPCILMDDMLNYGTYATSIETFSYLGNTLEVSTDLRHGDAASSDQRTAGLKISNQNTHSSDYDIAAIAFAGSTHPSVANMVTCWLNYDSSGIEYMENTGWFALPEFNGDGWHEAKIRINADRMLDFSLDGEIVYSSIHPLTSNYDGEIAIEIGGRKGLYDNVLVRAVPSSEAMVAIPHLRARAGEIVSIPVEIEIEAGISFRASEFDFSGYTDGLEFIGIDTIGTMIGGLNWAWADNEVDGVLHTAFAGSHEISGNGVFCYLEFLVIGDTCDTVPLMCDYAKFNDFEVTAIEQGGVAIECAPLFGDVDLDSDIDSMDASDILLYLVDSLELDSQKLANADTYFDTIVNALDASIILQYVVGIHDTLPVLPGGPEFLASGTLQMEETGATVNQPLSIPLNLSAGENIYSFEGILSYNPNFLTLDTMHPIVLSEGQEGFALVFKDDGNGHLKFAAARTHGNSEDGLFATFNFTNVIHLENNEETLVSMESFKLNSNLDVSVETIAIVSINQELAMPTQFILKQNYPNPFNPTTTIGYGLPESSDVSIIIYDVKGREVMNLVQTTQSAGWYDVSWKGMTNTNKQVSTGVYFARIQAGTFSDVIKMVYLR
mgnify:CR=1 FL=1